MIKTRLSPSLMLTACLSVAASMPALADTAHLEATIAGTRQGNTWFLCFPEESGCFSLHAATQGKRFPLSAGKLHQAFLLNRHTLRLASVPLPSDCETDLKEGQTLKVTGHIRADHQSGAHIDNLHCKITG